MPKEINELVGVLDPSATGTIGFGDFFNWWFKSVA